IEASIPETDEIAEVGADEKKAIEGIRKWVEDCKATWTGRQWKAFVISLYDDGRAVGMSQKRLEEIRDRLKNVWVEAEEARKEEEARIAEERRLVAQRIRKWIEGCQCEWSEEEWQDFVIGLHDEGRAAGMAYKELENIRDDEKKAWIRAVEARKAEDARIAEEARKEEEARIAEECRLVAQNIRKWIEDCQCEWSEEEWQDFIIGLRDEGRTAGMTYKELENIRDNEKKVWIREEEARKARRRKFTEEGRRAAEEAERKRKEAEKVLNRREDKRLFDEIKFSPTIQLCERYLSQYPNGKYLRKVEKMLVRLRDEHKGQFRLVKIVLILVVVIVAGYVGISALMKKELSDEQTGLIRSIVNSRTALIDTQAVGEGDTIYGVTVVRIHVDKVEFEKDGNRWTQGLNETPSRQWRAKTKTIAKAEAKAIAEASAKEEAEAEVKAKAEYDMLDVLVAQAKAAEKEGNLSEAMKCYLKAIKIEPSNTEIKAEILTLQEKLLQGGFRMSVALQTILVDLANVYDMVTFDRIRGIIKLKSDLLFEKDSDIVTSSAIQTVKALCKVLDSEEARQGDFIIAGHTDDIPILRPEVRIKHPTNWHLSAHRAISLLNMMASNNIRSERMSVRAFGECRPIENNEPNKRGNSQNRRIEIYIVAAHEHRPYSGRALPLGISNLLEDLDQDEPTITYDPRRGILTASSDLLFERGSDVTVPSAVSTIRLLCSILKTEVGKEFDIIIAGHTDDTLILRAADRDKHPTNWHLAANRAISVLQIMVAQGVIPWRMSVRSFGEFRPAELNEPNKNRRIEIYIVPKGA
ncbi:OmpA family protein, partial [Planctomycetota bacterium]